MTTYALTLRKTTGDIIAQDDVQADSIQQAVTTLYNDTLKPKPRRGIGLWNPFPGGTTVHVQMGYSGGGGTQLDSKIVVQYDVIDSE